MRDYCLSFAIRLRLAALAKLVVFVSVVFVSISLATCKPQIVQLQHPESHRWPLPLRSNNEPPLDSKMQKGEPQLEANQQDKSPNGPMQKTGSPSHGSRPPGSSEHRAMPGNVLVQFDDRREISNIKYVMNDGRLATLFARNQTNPYPNKARQDYLTYNSIEKVTGRLPGEEPIPPIALGIPSHNIEIFNSTLQGVSQLVGGAGSGEHVTIDLSGKPMDSIVSGVQGQGQGQAEGGGSNEGLKVLATIAVDALHASVHNGQGPPSIGPMVGRLRHKVAKKLHEIPRLVASKLQVKSSQGQRFVDKDALGNKEIVLSEGQAQQVMAAGHQPMTVGTNMRSPASSPIWSNALGNANIVGGNLKQQQQQSPSPYVLSDNANLMQAATMRSQNHLPSPPPEWM